MTARVALVAAGGPDVREAVASTLGERGWIVETWSSGSEPDFTEAVVDRHGRVDLLVAGQRSVTLAAVDEQPVDDWWAVIDENLGVAFRLARAAAPHLRSATGSIVLLASDWGVRGQTLGTASSAAAAGLIGLMRALARELAPVRVNAIAPGELDGADLEDRAAALEVSLDDLRAELAGLALLARLGTADDVAATVAFLASDAASFYTGQVLGPTGGRTRG